MKRKVKFTRSKALAIVLFVVLSVYLAHAPTAYGVEPQRFGHINIEQAVALLPEKSNNVLEERRLIDNGMIGVRIFRVYKIVPRHHHKYADTYLKILSGKVEVSIEGGKPFIVGPGEFLFWRGGVDHEVTRIVEEPAIFLAIDSPVRRKGDVVFFKKSKPNAEPKKW